MKKFVIAACLAVIAACVVLEASSFQDCAIQVRDYMWSLPQQICGETGCSTEEQYAEIVSASNTVLFEASQCSSPDKWAIMQVWSNIDPSASWQTKWQHRWTNIDEMATGG